MVEIGQIIVSNDEKYEVTQIWPVGASKDIDFIAKRTEQMGIDIEGNPVYAGRGFSYAVKNWELEEKTMNSVEEIKKRLSYTEGNDLFGAHYINDMKYLIEENERLKRIISQKEDEAYQDDLRASYHT